MTFIIFSCLGERVRECSGEQVFSFQFFNRATDFYEISYACYVNGSRSDVVFSRVRKIAEKRLFRHACPSVRMEQLGSLLTDFHEI